MDRAATVRRATRDAVGDISPAGFREDIESLLADGSPVPGVLTLLAAEAAGATPEAETDRAVGVQLIYDGLRLTRTLAADPPWLRGDSESANIDILAADVLVARGFSLLAETEAATAAVGVVQSFGRTQTDRRAEDAPLDRQLEADVLELALIAGTTAGGATPDDPSGLADEFVAAADSGLPGPDALFETAARERIAAVADGGGRPLNRND